MINDKTKECANYVKKKQKVYGTVGISDNGIDVIAVSAGSIRCCTCGTYNFNADCRKRNSNLK